jgi:hypothetical protein
MSSHGKHTHAPWPQATLKEQASLPPISAPQATSHMAFRSARIQQSSFMNPLALRPAVPTVTSSSVRRHPSSHMQRHPGGPLARLVNRPGLSRKKSSKETLEGMLSWISASSQAPDPPGSCKTSRPVSTDDARAGASGKRSSTATSLQQSVSARQGAGSSFGAKWSANKTSGSGDADSLTRWPPNTASGSTTARLPAMSVATGYRPRTVCSRIPLFCLWLGPG